ncbi:carbohydrate ABC transporter permease, partial [Ruminococcus bicirculans (ex Wegman et al. 2014)]|uniref:carbohydrate ABC transporter permease n=1 Tax=Ruminococcus bicirculans (ex Wegman et al. 2014) TaxID=1160721 RepID=UPI003A95B4C8
MASAAQRRIRSISYAKYGYFFILPFFLVYCFFQLYPLFNTFYLSFFGNGKKVDDFVGLQNFQALLFGTGMGRTSSAIHETFIQTLGNTFIVWIGNFIPQIVLSLALAVWFTDAKLKIKGKGFFKVVMYMPNILTAASIAALYLSLFAESKYGPVNNLLMSIGIIDNPIKFVTGVWQSRGMVMFIQCWMWFGNTMIMLMSGIMGLNPSLFEAANIDGASSGQVFRKITLPLLSPMMLYTVVTSMIGGLQMFDIPYMYTKGTQRNEYTKTAAVFIYEHFREKMPNPNYGFSAAASVILFFITIILGSVAFYMNRDKDELAKKKERKANMKALKAKQKGLGG